MLRHFLLLIALLSPMLAYAQGGQYTLIQSSPEPLPSCTPAIIGQRQPMIWDVTAAQLKVCTAVNTWTPPSGGSISAAISSLTGAGIANAINSGDYPQTWNWSLTSFSRTGLLISENIASTSGGTPILFRISTLPASTANPAQFDINGNGVRVNTSGLLVAVGSGGINATQYRGGTASGTGACIANTFASTLNDAGAPTCTQPAFSNLSGTAAKAQLPAAIVYVDQSNTFTAGTQDFSGVAHTLPALKGAISSKPATCTIGEMYFATDATAGQNWFYCTATNTWVQQLNSGSAAGSGSELQARLTGSSLQAVTGSSTSAGSVTLAGTMTATQFITSGTGPGALKLNEAQAQGLNVATYTVPSTAFSNVTFVLPVVDGTAGQFLKTDGAGNLTFASAAGGAGTVTSFSVVGNVLAPLFTTSVATATTTPALTFTLTNAAAGTVFGNNTAASAAPTYNSIPMLANSAAPASPAAGFNSQWTDSTDLRFHDKNSAGTIGTTVVSDTGVANNFLTGVSIAGAITKARPTCGNLSDSAASCAIDATNATNISSGSMALARLAAPLNGIGLVRSVSGTTDTLLAADCFANVIYTSATAVAVTVPQATGSFAAPCPIHIRVTGAGVATLTPTTSTIDTFTSIGMNQFTDVTIHSDSTNWQTQGVGISVKNAALSVNTLQVQPSIAAAAVVLTSIGSDTNIGVTLKSKGTGTLLFQPGSNTSAAFTIANATGTGLFRVDSTNSRVGIGSAAPAATFDIKGFTQWNANGLQTLDNNTVTVGNGHPIDFYNTAQTTQRASVATQNIASPGADTMYEVGFNVSQLDIGAGCTGGAGGNVGVNIIYTDAVTGTSYTIVVPIESSAGTALLANLPLSGGTPAIGVANVGWSGPVRIRVKTGTNTLQYSTTYTNGTGCSTQPGYNIYPIVRVAS